MDFDENLAKNHPHDDPSARKGTTQGWATHHLDGVKLEAKEWNWRKSEDFTDFEQQIRLLPDDLLPSIARNPFQYPRTEADIAYAHSRCFVFCKLLTKSKGLHREPNCEPRVGNISVFVSHSLE